MGWKQLIPETSVKVKANITLGVNKTKGGRFYCSIIFSEPFLMELDKKWGADRCAFAGVFEGEGKEEGKVMVLFSEAEKFRITHFEKGGARIQAPLFECLRAVCYEAEQVTYEYGDRLSLILTVPLLSRMKKDTLQPQRQASPYMPKPKVTEEVALPPVKDATVKIAQAAIGNLVNPFTMLRSRGISIDKGKSGAFVLDGKGTDRIGVLQRINTIRKNEGQALLTVHHVNWE